MLQETEKNSKLSGDSASIVYVVESPNVVGRYKARAYGWYVRYSLGIVINKAPIDPGKSIRGSFPDAGYLEGPIDPSLFIGITIPQEIWESSIEDLKSKGIDIKHDCGMNNVMISELIDMYNIEKLPIYDSETGNLLKEYLLEEELNKNCSTK